MLNSLQGKQVGFYGKESYDIIIIQALILKNLGKRVLMIEQSKEHELSYCVNQCNELDIKNEIITYNDIDFTYQGCNVYGDYDYILIHFGFNINQLDLFILDHIFLVSDMQDYNLDRIRQFKNKNLSLDVIIRNIINTTKVTDIKKYFILNSLPIENVYLLDMNEKDTSVMYSINNKSWKGFRKLSYEYKDMIKMIFLTRYVIDQKVYKKAFNQLEKRGY